MAATARRRFDFARDLLYRLVKTLGSQGSS